ncbi:MAG: Aminotransferase, DegT/DnrJ/EryC1/StrS family [uncultured Truepera sp.]|uniref:Aminotransferase, DegT/DnrJ/EryC1/StrS family n=1 Tax=uncultured Truepera sp. TaxID=543023 RepID=A0A6J4UNJ1_9DEIN|nr:MAG: Aminotransferase, DegT/DnrJ/EryC1/StrS family [uncultured Truepera sp.]
MIRLFDVRVPGPVQERLEAAVLETLRSGQFVLGERVARFEAEFAAYTEAAHAVGVGSGTDALVLSLRALGVGPGDEVIVPALSFYASAEAVLLVGAEPVLVDVDPHTLNLSAGAAEAALTARTKALMPVHLYGCPADMPAVAELAQKHGLKVIEDAAQASGANLDGQPLGSWSDACCYSFYPTKNLGAAGDGGLVTTPHAEVAESVRLLRTHGATRPYYHEAVGTTSRLDALQAVVLSVKLPCLDPWNARRRDLAKRYDEALAALPVTVLRHQGGVYHLYVVRVPQRDRVMRFLNENGVEARAYYPYALPDLPPLRGKEHGDCREARAAARELLALPLHPNLHESEVAEVVETLAHALR